MTSLAAAILIGLDFAGGVIIIWRAICTLNRMTPESCHTIAIAWVLLGGAALAEVRDLFALSSPPDWQSVMIVTAVAWFLLVDRRRR